MKGVSKRRNELIADIFARMQLAERLGSGLKRVAKLMDAAKQPRPKIDSNLFFTITFKRPSYSELSDSGSDKSSDKSSDKTLEFNYDMILNKIERNPQISAKKLAEILGVTPRTIEKYLSNLKLSGIIQRVGSKKHGYWKRIKVDTTHKVCDNSAKIEDMK